MRELEYWKRIVRGCTYGLTDAQVEAAARICYDTEQAYGVSCGAWHAVAVVVEKPCFCARCRPDVRRFA